MQVAAWNDGCGAELTCVETDSSGGLRATEQGADSAGQWTSREKSEKYEHYTAVYDKPTTIIKIIHPLHVRFV